MHHHFLGRRQSRRIHIAVVSAACLWFLYAIYEWRMQKKGYNIRVDLLAITPVLWIASALGVLAYLSGLRRRSLGRGFPIRPKSGDGSAAV